MKGDFSRLTFHRRRHYSSVRLQQGRVQLDADWNEQVDIGEHRERTTTVDVVGRAGAPYDLAGFGIAPAGSDLAISHGRMYVDGILCENESRGLRYTDQPSYPGAALPDTAGRYFAFLDVWERHLTAVERPELREVALGGPDSATRTEVVWQVRLEQAPEGATSCVDFDPPQVTRGTLRAQADPAPPPADACDVPPAGGFRGLENQLYRVEIEDPNGPVFKWSRDNGSILTRLETVDATNTAITVSDPGKDAVLAFGADEWIEILDETRVLLDQPGYLVQISIPTGTTLKLTSLPAQLVTDYAANPNPGGGWTVRRWDGTGTATPGTWQELESGVDVEFKGGPYLRGDYWTIPARTITGGVEWPLDQAGDPDYRAPMGIRHHVAPLALLDFSTTGDGSSWTVVHDCRRLFPPLTEETAFYYVGGDGQETMPHSTTLVLPEPLEVGVSNGRYPVAGATVHFEIAAGAGTLLDADSSGNVLTGEDGIASCRWQLDAALVTQRVTATLLDDAGNEVQTAIHFTAGLSIAAEVAYDPGSCPTLAPADTVQAAIATLAAAPAIAFAGGDGQEGRPGEDLGSPLTVGVGSTCGPLAAGSGAVVRFTTQSGNGVLRETDSTLLVRRSPDGLTLDVSTDAEGLANAIWTLEPVNGDSPQVQQARATLLDPTGNATGLPVLFNASLADTGAGPDPGVHVKGLSLLAGGALDNDLQVTTDQLLRGIRIDCDGDLDRLSVLGKPTVFVTLDLPYPLIPPDIEAWGDPGMLGTQPLVLLANVNVDNNAILWIPQPQLAQWLHGRLWDAVGRYKLRELIAHLTLKGNVTWSLGQGGGTGLLYLDGDAFGVPRPDSTSGQQRTGLRLPSGDGRAGGDFQLWFHLVP